MSTPAAGSGAWTGPAVDEVVPGVHRIPLPLPNDGLRAVNVYVLTSDDDVTLIDAGWAIAASRELLLASLAGLDIGPGDIDRFLVTHVHRDHYTQAVALRREFGTHVALGSDERPSLDILMSDNPDPLAHYVRALREMGATALAELIASPAAVAAAGHDATQWALPDEWLHAGQLEVGPRRLDVVPTPGHTRGHVVFHDLDAGLLFAGDHVLPTITPSIGFEPAPSDDPLGAFLHSLAVVRERPDAMLLPAHGPVAPSVHARVDELLDHHGRRLDEAAAAIGRGAGTAYEAAGLLTWTRRERALVDLDPFNQMLAVGETAAHLHLLAAQGRLTAAPASASDGVRRFTT